MYVMEVTSAPALSL